MRDFHKNCIISNYSCKRTPTNLPKTLTRLKEMYSRMEEIVTLLEKNKSGVFEMK